MPARANGVLPGKSLRKAVSDLGRKLRGSFTNNHKGSVNAAPKVNPPLRVAPVKVASVADKTLHTSVKSPHTRIPFGEPVSRRNIAMPADPRQPDKAEFPFAVNYSIANSPVAVQRVYSLADSGLKSALRSAIQSRQGAFDWVQEGQLGLRAQIQQLLDSDEICSLGEGVCIHDLFCAHEFSGGKRWQLLVSAPALDKPGEADTFTVPLSEMLVPSGGVDLGSFTLESDIAWQSHLSHVDSPYQDSVDNPMILSTGCNLEADLHALHVEMSSRIQAGVVGDQTALLTALKKLAPEFVKEKPANAPGLLLPELRRQLEQFDPDNLMSPHGLLARKRHFPSEAPPAFSLFRQSTAASVGSVADLISFSDSDTSEPSAPRWLTLADKEPLCRPNHKMAFRQMAKDNHCGIVSVNGFFQAEVMNSTQAVNNILEKYAHVYQVQCLTELNLPGLFHPSLINGFKNGQSVTINRADFVNGPGLAKYSDYSAIYSAPPEDQWDALCNYRFQGSTVGNHPERLEITPDLWISAATGIHADSLEHIVNSFLESKAGNTAWVAYPDSVRRIPTGDPTVRKGLEDTIDQIIQTKPAQLENTNFPMICMTHGHYFAVARAENGDWLKLDSNGTNKTGLQAPELFAKRGQLKQAMEIHNVIHIICEPLNT